MNVEKKEKLEKNILLIQPAELKLPSLFMFMLSVNLCMWAEEDEGNIRHDLS